MTEVADILTATIGEEDGLIGAIRRERFEREALILSNERLRAALRAIRVGEVNGKLYIGVIAAEGCWSVALEDHDGQRLFKEWMKQRDAALEDGR